MSDQNLPKDRNARVREALLKKRAEREQKAIQLAPGELVDDALARAADRSVRWATKNASVIGWAILATIAGGAGWLAWDYRATQRMERASAELANAALQEQGRIGEAPKADPSMPDVRTPPWFKTADEKRDAVLKAYERVATDFAGTGPALLAKLGEANALLDQREWDKAVEAFRAVKSSPLAKADADVRGRAIEGEGYGLEGKGDADGAAKAFRELENTDVKGFKELGQYHQARLLLAHGNRDKAKEILKPLSEKLHGPTEGKSATNLTNDVDDLLRRIDPGAVPAKPALGNRPMTPEDLARIQEQIRRMQEKSKGGAP